MGAKTKTVQAKQPESQKSNRVWEFHRPRTKEFRNSKNHKMALVENLKNGTLKQGPFLHSQSCLRHNPKTFKTQVSPRLFSFLHPRSCLRHNPKTFKTQVSPGLFSFLHPRSCECVRAPGLVAPSKAAFSLRLFVFFDLAALREGAP